MLGLAALAGNTWPATAQEVNLEPRVEVGHCRSAAGTLLVNERPGRAWEVVAPNRAVSSRDRLLALSGIRAEIEPSARSVRLTLWGNLPQLSSFAGRESEVILHDSRAFDLDVTLLRGRVVVDNHKAKGSARLWVRLPGEAWQLTLAEPGARVALEMYGRWPLGVPFSRDLRTAGQPTRLLTLLVLKGKAELKAAGQPHALSAPPGPASFSWDSVTGAPEGPQQREHLPEWADKETTSPESEAVAQVIKKYQALLKGKQPGSALGQLLSEADKGENKDQAQLTREFAVQGLAALEEVGRVAEALSDFKHPDVRAAAILALRHWIGTAPGNDLQLFQVLIERLEYPPPQADTILQLLHSPFDPSQPETYETLISYLGHNKLPIRALAWWHLQRLVPPNRQVRYDPAASPDEREKAREQWRKLIPSGSLPPKK